MIRKYIIWTYFLVFPLTNAYMPNLDLGVVEFDPFRLYQLIPIIYVIDLFLRNGGRIRISKETTILFIYIVFSRFNTSGSINQPMRNALNSEKTM